MLKTVELLSIFKETVIHFFLGFFDEYKVQKNSIQIFCNIIHVFTVTSDLISYLLIKSINYFQKQI